MNSFSVNLAAVIMAGIIFGVPHFTKIPMNVDTYQLLGAVVGQVVLANIFSGFKV